MSKRLASLILAAALLAGVAAPAFAAGPEIVASGLTISLWPPGPLGLLAPGARLLLRWLDGDDAGRPLEVTPTAPPQAEKEPLPSPKAGPAIVAGG